MLLLLLRHAKSDWSSATGDHDRPLAVRGRKAALEIGTYIAERHYVPAQVLCSTAVRTRRTLELAQRTFGGNPDIFFERGVYLAEWPRLIGEIRAVAGDEAPLMLVGHNPGIEQLAAAMARPPEDEAERMRGVRLAEKFPAGGLAVFDFAIARWQDVKLGTGRFADYVRPRDLDALAGEPE